MVMAFSCLEELKALTYCVSMLGNGIETRSMVVVNALIQMAQSIKGIIDMISLTVSDNSSGLLLRMINSYMCMKETGEKVK
jgi:hypothetical protein